MIKIRVGELHVELAQLVRDLGKLCLERVEFVLQWLARRSNPLPCYRFLLALVATVDAIAFFARALAAACKNER